MNTIQDDFNSSQERTAAPGSRLMARFATDNLHVLLTSDKKGALDLAEISRLIASGADVNWQDIDGMTGLMTAVYKGKPAAAAACGLMLTAGMDTSLTCWNGYSLLHWAADRGDKDMIAVLVAAGAKIDQKSRGGMTPLMCATYEENLEGGLLLVKAGADPDLRDDRGLTAFEMLPDKVTTDRLARIELVSTALAMAKDRKPPPPPGLGERLIEEVRKESPDIALVKDLIDKGADLSVTDDCGDTALHYACSRGRSHRAIVVMLIEGKAPLDAQNGMGDTPLMIASHEVPVIDDVVEILLCHGASLNLKNKEGKTAYDFAKQGGYTAVLKVLDKALAREREIERQKRDAWIAKGAPVKEDVTTLPRIRLKKGKGPSS